MLPPVTYALEPTSALITLAGIYYAAQYGGSTTAILVDPPGEASSVVTCLDGYQMARHGGAGQALTVAAIGSLVGGCVGTLMLLGIVGTDISSSVERYTFGSSPTASTSSLSRLASSG
jgi:TctA family transporter